MAQKSDDSGGPARDFQVREPELRRDNDHVHGRLCQGNESKGQVPQE